jgi:hypothetical protein
MTFYRCLLVHGMANCLRIFVQVGVCAQPTMSYPLVHEINFGANSADISEFGLEFTEKFILKSTGWNVAVLRFITHAPVVSFLSGMELNHINVQEQLIVRQKYSSWTDATISASYFTIPVLFQFKIPGNNAPYLRMGIYQNWLIWGDIEGIRNNWSPVPTPGGGNDDPVSAELDVFRRTAGLHFEAGYQKQASKGQFIFKAMGRRGFLSSPNRRQQLSTLSVAVGFMPSRYVKTLKD